MASLPYHSGVKLAVLSDIHGIPIALDAVLADIEQRGGVDGYLGLGDLVAQGYDPVSAAKTLAALPNAHFVRGNTDRYVCARGLPRWLDFDHVEPERLDLVRSHAWTTGCLAAAGLLEWVQAIPLEYRFDLPDGTRVLCVHASPGKDDGSGLRQEQTDEEFSALLAGCEADLVLVGHTHWPFDRSIAGVRVVNPGSVGYPRRTDLRGSYALIEADESGYTVEIHRVGFDIDAVIRAVETSGFYPNPEWVIAHYSRESLPA